MYVPTIWTIFLMLADIVVASDGATCNYFIVLSRNGIKGEKFWQNTHRSIFLVVWPLQFLELM